MRKNALRAARPLIDAGKLTGKDMACAYINRGDALFSINDYYQAIDDFGAAIRLYPKDAKPYNNPGLHLSDAAAPLRGLARCAQGRRARARERGRLGHARHDLCLAETEG